MLPSNLASMNITCVESWEFVGVLLEALGNGQYFIKQCKKSWFELSHVHKKFLYTLIKNIRCCNYPMLIFVMIVAREAWYVSRNSVIPLAVQCTCTECQDLILLASSLLVNPFLICVLKHESLFCFHALFLPVTFVLCYCSTLFILLENELDVVVRS